MRKWNQKIVENDNPQWNHTNKRWSENEGNIHSNLNAKNSVNYDNTRLEEKLDGNSGLNENTQNTSQPENNSNKSNSDICGSKSNLIDTVSSDQVSSENEENLKFKATMRGNEAENKKQGKSKWSKKVSIHFKGKKDKKNEEFTKEEDKDEKTNKTDRIKSDKIDKCEDKRDKDNKNDKNTGKIDKNSDKTDKKNRTNDKSKTNDKFDKSNDKFDKSNDKSNDKIDKTNDKFGKSNDKLDKSNDKFDKTNDKSIDKLTRKESKKDKTKNELKKLDTKLSKVQDPPSPGSAKSIDSKKRSRFDLFRFGGDKSDKKVESSKPKMLGDKKFSFDKPMENKSKCLRKTSSLDLKRSNSGNLLEPKTPGGDSKLNLDLKQRIESQTSSDSKTDKSETNRVGEFGQISMVERKEIDLNERIDRDRKEKERIERDRVVKDPEKDRIDRINRLDSVGNDKEHLDKDNLGRLDKDRLDKDHLDQLDKDRLDRLDKDHLDKDRSDKERSAKDRSDKDRSDKDRSDKERSDKDRLDRIDHADHRYHNHHADRHNRDRKSRKSVSVSPDRRHHHDKKHRKKKMDKFRQRRSTLSNERFNRERSYSVCTDRSNILDNRFNYGFRSGYWYDDFPHSDRDSLSSLETVQRRKMSQMSNIPANGKIPWCGCWGNGCL